MPEKPKKTNGKNGRKKKPSGRSTKAELSERREHVYFLRIVQRLSVPEIAKKLNKSMRQIKRDCAWNKKHNNDPQKNETTSKILSQIMSSFDARYKRLWADVDKIQKLEDAGDFIDPKAISLRLRLSKEMRESESALVESLRKLGYGIGDGGESDDEVLLSIKARYAKRNSNNSGSDDTDSPKA